MQIIRKSIVWRIMQYKRAAEQSNNGIKCSLNGNKTITTALNKTRAWHINNVRYVFKSPRKHAIDGRVKYRCVSDNVERKGIKECSNASLGIRPSVEDF